MTTDALFDTDENKALIAICTRKLISNIGVGGIIWGVINTTIGIMTVRHTMLNLGLVFLGLLMLGTGVHAVRSPSLHVLLTETIVTILLFIWNLALSILKFRAFGTFEPQGLIFPLIVVVIFANYYRKLGHLSEQIASVEPAKIKATKQICKTLLKQKLKNEPSVIQTTDRRCRAQLMDESAFFIQRDLMRAFVGTKQDIAEAVVKPDAKSLQLQFNHPVGKLKYYFDKKNSEKLKEWLSVESVSKFELDAGCHS